jgi:hypothetical protein
VPEEKAKKKTKKRKRWLKIADLLILNNFVG